MTNPSDRQEKKQVTQPAATHREEITSYDLLPKFSELLFDSDSDIKMTNDDHRYFLFAKSAEQGQENIVYLLTAASISAEKMQRAKSLSLIVRHKYALRRIKTTAEIIGIAYKSILGNDAEIENISVSVADKPLYETIESMFEEAISKNASDIHIEAFEKKTDIKLRINGMLVKVNEFSSDHTHEIVRILYNVLAIEGSKDIQFDEFKMQSAIVEKTIAKRLYRVRVQTAPRYPHGYSIALRLLPYR